MADIPENLQVIKLEPISPTSDDKIPDNIKAKLNQHVKRRLQDFAGLPNQDGNEHLHIGSSGQQKAQQSDRAMLKLESTSIGKEQQQQQQRQKRPYHKRTDRSKTSAAALARQSNLIESPSIQQRRYKTKLKATLTTGNPDTLTPNSQDDTCSQPMSANAGAISAGDEDEMGGGHDDLRSGREKEKCPDVLSMVLSMKKRALLQDPEVQHFLSEVMKVIKS